VLVEKPGNGSGTATGSSAGNGAATPSPSAGSGAATPSPAVSASGARVLLAQRPPGKANAGLWEFPGGKVNKGLG
jgi:8-oxo-dGTP pyrophosphatase MutT (NUDIX family)